MSCFNFSICSLCFAFVFSGLFVVYLNIFYYTVFFIVVFKYIFYLFIYFLMAAPGNTVLQSLSMDILPIKVNYRNLTKLFRYFNSLPFII